MQKALKLFIVIFLLCAFTGAGGQEVGWGDTSSTEGQNDPAPDRPQPQTVCNRGHEGCTIVHSQCQICRNWDCEKSHSQCEVCKKYDCTVAHLQCTVCNKWDCTTNHKFVVPKTYTAGIQRKLDDATTITENPQRHSDDTVARATVEAGRLRDALARIRSLEAGVRALRGSSMTRAQLDRAIKDLVSKAQLNDMLKKYVTFDDLTNRLGNFYTKGEVDAALANHPTKEDLKSYAKKDDLKPYARQDELPPVPLLWLGAILAPLIAAAVIIAAIAFLVRARDKKPKAVVVPAKSTASPTSTPTPTPTPTPTAKPTTPVVSAPNPATASPTTAVADPEITSLKPDRITVGKAVNDQKIFGHKLATASKVILSLTGQPLVTIDVNQASDSVVTCNVPALAYPGDWKIRVKMADGSLSDEFPYPVDKK